MTTQIANHSPKTFNIDSPPNKSIKSFQQYNLSEVTRSIDDSVKKNITLKNTNTTETDIDKKPSELIETKKFNHVKNCTSLNKSFVSNLINYIN